MNIEDLKGVGPKTARLLNKLDIYTTNDLLSYYPYKYNIYHFSDLIESNDNLIVNAIIESNPTVSYIKKNFNRLSFRANISKKIVNVTIFNRAFLKNNLTIGKNVTLIGKYDLKKNCFTASDIKFNIKNGDIESVYHLTNGINSSTITKLISSIIDKYQVYDYIPEIYSKNYNFIDKQTAIHSIHIPKNINDVKQAKIRLIYEELFEFSFKMNVLKVASKQENGLIRNFDKEKVELLIQSLPFKLTEDQLKAKDEIIDDLLSNNRMNRLVLGDVGSGKTIVSVIAIYANLLGGFQSTLMAPTEILAMQHYYGIKKYLDNFNVSTEIITGSMTKREKQKIYERLENGEIDLLIGTHALLTDDIKFKNLGLVITDEQHRFGVNQRGTLENKGIKPDTLYLSATPIPRTYAMTIYGDLDVSLIKTKPMGRLPIITKVRKEKDIKEVLEKMLEQINLGHQIYVVSPLVDSNDEIDLKSVKYLKEKMDIAFNNKVRIEIIHGKLKQAEKDSIMNDFKNNQIKILISTTVIEVGVDVSNATAMVIFNAERFGLATLHQLRGRVGRSNLQSYCYLISDYETERLSVMEESNDGFYISQKDFEIRGHGDLFGTRQHGDMHFKLANLNNDYKILVQAQKDSDEFLKSERYLENHYYTQIAQDLNITN